MLVRLGNEAKYGNDGPSQDPRLPPRQWAHHFTPCAKPRRGIAAPVKEIKEAVGDGSSLLSHV